MSTICYAIAAFIFFCLAVDLFQEVEKGVRVDWLGLFFVALGLALGAWPAAWPWRR